MLIKKRIIIDKVTGMGIEGGYENPSERELLDLIFSLIENGSNPHSYRTGYVPGVWRYDCIRSDLHIVRCCQYSTFIGIQEVGWLYFYPTLSDRGVIKCHIPDDFMKKYLEKIYGAHRYTIKKTKGKKDYDSCVKFLRMNCIKHFTVWTTGKTRHKIYYTNSGLKMDWNPNPDINIYYQKTQFI